MTRESDRSTGAADAAATDLAAEVAALRSGLAVADRGWLDRLELRGLDRLRFLHGLVTCDVKNLGVGATAYGFVTSGKGMILAEVTVLALPDRLILELPPGAGETIAAHLARYVVADRVEIAPAELAAIAVVGPATAASAATAPWAGPLLAGGPASEVRPGAWAFGRAVAGLPAVQVWGDGAAVGGLAAELVAVGAVAASFAAVEQVRIENGVPRHGADFAGDTLPQETGLDAAAVSYTKGCYLGQEVVARIHYRGGVQRGMRGLRFAEAAAPPPAGTPVVHEGREAGRVGSGATSPVHGAIALALLHKRAFEPGTRVEADGVAAEVVALPFAG